MCVWCVQYRLEDANRGQKFYTMVLETVASGLTDMDFDSSRTYLVAVTKNQASGAVVPTHFLLVPVYLCTRHS